MCKLLYFYYTVSPYVLHMLVLIVVFLLAYLTKNLLGLMSLDMNRWAWVSGGGGGGGEWEG